MFGSRRCRSLIFGILPFLLSGCPAQTKLASSAPVTPSTPSLRSTGHSSGGLAAGSSSTSPSPTPPAPTEASGTPDPTPKPQMARFDAIHLTVDIRGNGMQDICARSSSGALNCWLAPDYQTTFSLNALGSRTEFVSPSTEATLQYAHLQDRRTDVCARGLAGVHCWLSTGQDFGPPDGAASFVLTDFSHADGWGLPAYNETIKFAKVMSGAAIDQIGARFYDGYHVWAVDPKTGKLTELTGFALPSLSDANHYDDPKLFTSFRLVDVNGDGLADLCHFTPAKQLVCHLSNGQGFDPAITVASGIKLDSTLKASLSLQFADVGGNGIPSAFWEDGSGLQAAALPPPIAPTILKSLLVVPGLDNNTTDPLSGFRLAALPGASNLRPSATFLDLDGDGRADVCLRGSGGTQCFLAGPTGFQKMSDSPMALLSDGNGGNQSQYAMTLQGIKPEADGAYHLCARSAQGEQCFAMGSGTMGPSLSIAALGDTKGFSGLLTQMSLRAFAAEPPPTVTLSGVSPAQSETTSTTVTMSFSSNEAGNFTCQLDGGNRDACSGSITYNGLAVGSHTIRIVETNGAGGTGEADYQVKVDSPMPAPVPVYQVSFPYVSPFGQRQFFTTDYNEAVYMINRWGYQNLTVPFHAFSPGNAPAGAVPLYRCWVGLPNIVPNWPYYPNNWAYSTDSSCGGQQSPYNPDPIVNNSKLIAYLLPANQVLSTPGATGLSLFVNGGALDEDLTVYPYVNNAPTPGGTGWSFAAVLGGAFY